MRVGIGAPGKVILDEIPAHQTFVLDGVASLVLDRAEAEELVDSLIEAMAEQDHRRDLKRDNSEVMRAVDVRENL